MKIKKLLTLIGSICLTLVLAVMLLPACAPAAPGEEADCSDVEADLAASEKKVGDLEDEVSDLEKEIAALKKPAEVMNWKPVTEKPPTTPHGVREISEPILVYQDIGVAQVCRYVDPGSGVEPYFRPVNHGEYDLSLRQATHWMELPEEPGVHQGDPFVREWSDRFGFLASQNPRDSVESIDEVACLLYEVIDELGGCTVAPQPKGD